MTTRIRKNSQDSSDSCIEARKFKRKQIESFNTLTWNDIAAQKSMYESLPIDIIIKMMQDMIVEGDYKSYLSLCQTSSYIRKACKRLEEDMPIFWYSLLEKSDNIGAMSDYLKTAFVWDKNMTNNFGIKNPNYGKIIAHDKFGNKTEDMDYIGKSIYQLWKIFMIDKIGISSIDVIDLAWYNKFPEKIKYLVKMDENVYERNIIHHTAHGGNIDLMKFLQERYQRDFEQNKNHILLYSGTVDMVKYLIENGADITYMDTFDNDLLTLSIDNDNFPVFKYVSELVDIQNRYDPLQLLSSSVYSGNVDIMNSLHHIFPNEFDNNKNKILVYCKTVDMAKYLIENGADVTYYDPYDQCKKDIIHIATQFNYLPLVIYLTTEHGDKYTDYDLEFLAELAMINGSKETLEYYLDMGILIHND